MFRFERRPNEKQKANEIEILSGKNAFHSTHLSFIESMLYIPANFLLLG